MEVRIYDSLNRNVLITVALTAGLLAAFNMFLLLPHQGTRVPTTGATIRIERPSGRVFQLDFLFRLEVRRQRFNLSEFFRAGYQVPRRSGPGRRSSLRRTWEPRVTAQKKLLRNVDRRSAISYKGSGGTL